MLMEKYGNCIRLINGFMTVSIFKGKNKIIAARDWHDHPAHVFYCGLICNINIIVLDICGFCIFFDALKRISSIKTTLYRPLSL